MLRELFCRRLSCTLAHNQTKCGATIKTSKRRLALSLVCLLLSSQICISESRAQDAAKDSAHLYFFTDHGCAPCRQVEPSIAALKQEGYPVSTVYLSSNREMATRFGVDRTPTVVLMTGSKMAGRHAGLIDAVTLKQWFAAVGMPSGSVFSSVNGKAAPVGGTKVLMSGASRSRPGQDSFSTPTIRKGTERPSNLKERLAMDATVRLKVEDPKGTSYATGTVIHNHQGECLVMTCGHVFRDAKGKGEITAEYGFGRGSLKTAPGQLIFYDADARDIALVAIRTSELIKPVPIAPKTSGVERGNDIFSIGCDHGDDPTIRHSRIKNRAAYDGAIKYDIYGRPVDGRSGGGLFNDKGELIGVCNAAAVEVDEGIYTALDTIYWQLAKVNLEHLFDSSSMLASRSIGSETFTNNPAALSNSSIIGGSGSGSGGSGQFASREFSNPDSSLSANVNEPKSRLAALRSSSAIRVKPAMNAAANSGNRTQVSWNQNGKSDQEVIIIVRSKSDPSQTQAITVSDPSPKLLDYLGSMRSSESNSRQLNMANWRKLN